MGMFIVHFLPYSNIALVIAIIIRATEKFHTVAIFLMFYRNKRYIFPQALLQYIIPGPKHKRH
jgi:NADH:ubiquinone oxidoreductase subunit K